MKFFFLKGERTLSALSYGESVRSKRALPIDNCVDNDKLVHLRPNSRAIQGFCMSHSELFWAVSLVQHFVSSLNAALILGKRCVSEIRQIKLIADRHYEPWFTITVCIEHFIELSYR